jgi:hypothetical protein
MNFNRRQKGIGYDCGAAATSFVRFPVLKTDCS